MQDFPIIQGLRTKPKPGGQKDGFEDVGERISKSTDGHPEHLSGSFLKRMFNFIVTK